MQTSNYPSANSFLDTLLKAHSEALGPIYNDPGKYRLQVIYTRIDRDAQNRPHFQDYFFRLDTSQYFYPASTVKLPAIALALEKLNDLNIPELDMHTPMFTDSLSGITSAVLADSSAENGLPSVAQYIKKILLVSDNDAFNRLYEFIGQQSFNESLWAKGYPNTQIRHRVGISGVDAEENRHTNAITFRRNGQVLYQQPARYSSIVFSPRHDRMGKSYYNDQHELVNSPMDASMKNRVPLSDLHSMLRSIIFPESVTKQQRFRLNESDYRYLYHCMSAQPEESVWPSYDTIEYHHNYVKFLLFGGEKQHSEPKDVRIFNKPGWAYGFLTDVAYIADFSHKVEFMLSATVYVNDDGILSDEHYQFETTGEPFMKALGAIIYQYELQRKKQYLPDLSRFMMEYGRSSK
ncbi:serine hydrolase [Chitinophaga sp. CF118]|uniref:serine hydrolase n=1 Tax=Chitinophaga sp. CF118 TaxID=1884367 RepID=UPI000B7F3892|nr:serine hydrolase [Chitinophaga sp. CF118]